MAKDQWLTLLRNTLLFSDSRLMPTSVQEFSALEPLRSNCDSLFWKAYCLTVCSDKLLICCAHPLMASISTRALLVADVVGSRSSAENFSTNPTVYRFRIARSLKESWTRLMSSATPPISNSRATPTSARGFSRAYLVRSDMWQFVSENQLSNSMPGHPANLLCVVFNGENYLFIA